MTTGTHPGHFISERERECVCVGGGGREICSVLVLVYDADVQIHPNVESK